MANGIYGMSVIKNDNNKPSENEGQYTKKEEKYTLPAVIRFDEEDLTIEKSFLISLIVHPLILLLCLISSFLMQQLGLIQLPIEEPKDIEFVLVEREAPPIDKNTKNRADMNSQAGGKHDPKRPVSLPQTSAPKSNDKKPTPPASQPKKAEVKQQNPQPQKQQVTQSKPQPVSTPAPKAPAPKPMPQPAMRPVVTNQNPQSNFNIPIPKSSIPQIAQPTTAPITSRSKQAGGSSTTSAGTSAKPSFSPTMSGVSGANGSTLGGGGRFSGYGTGKGNVGNPSPGNPNGIPGIDAIKEPDFGPYMKELQRRIKLNWDPPQGNESKRVVLLFTIARDGRLLNIKIHKSSGLQAADNAAINAVKLTAPFRPLPPDYRNNSIDIQFTFDYNVFGVSG